MTRTWSRAGQGWGVALVLALPTRAAGQAAAPAGEGEAKARGEKLFEEASAAYNLGKFDQAIERFEAAYELLKKPSLLYNLGQAHVRQHETDGDVGHLRRARALYDNFIKIREAGGESVGDARERLAAVDAKLAALPTTPEPASETAPEPASEPKVLPEPAPPVEPAPKVEPRRRGPGGLGIAGIGLIAGGALAGGDLPRRRGGPRCAAGRCLGNRRLGPRPHPRRRRQGGGPRADEGD